MLGAQSEMFVFNPFKVPPGVPQLTGKWGDILLFPGSVSQTMSNQNAHSHTSEPRASVPGPVSQKHPLCPEEEWASQRGSGKGHLRLRLQEVTSW